jgi:hypothetical protein
MSNPSSAFITLATLFQLLTLVTLVTPQVNPQLVMDLLPSIAILDPVWVNKVMPALSYLSPDYLVAVVKAIAPSLQKINPDQLVALVPAVSKISVSTWEKMIELLNKLTAAQVRHGAQLFSCGRAAACDSCR